MIAQNHYEKQVRKNDLLKKQKRLFWLFNSSAKVQKVVPQKKWHKKPQSPKTEKYREEQAGIFVVNERSPARYFRNCKIKNGTGRSEIEMQKTMCIVSAQHPILSRKEKAFEVRRLSEGVSQAQNRPLPLCYKHSMKNGWHRGLQ